MKKEKNKNIVVKKKKNGAIELRSDSDGETLWATQKEIAQIFKVTPQNITIHLKQIFKDGELKEKSTCKESLQVQIEGSRKVKRKVKEYNLDVLIAVGYRINSVVGTKFRQWSNKVLKSHIVDGYTINPSRINGNLNNFLSAVDDMKKLVSKESKSTTDDILELVKMIASTWFSLDAYDKAELPKKGLSKKKVTFTADELKKDLLKLKKELINRKEATEFFAQEKQNGNLEGIVGNVLQSFGGKNVYLTLEEKAAHLLYFIIKNHPFIDGNKRSGAFSFVWFLRRFDILDTNNITPEALTALTLLIAESKPSEKERMIGLVLLLLKKN